jgi:hypothetical protein
MYLNYYSGLSELGDGNVHLKCTFTRTICSEFSLCGFFARGTLRGIQRFELAINSHFILKYYVLRTLFIELNYANFDFNVHTFKKLLFILISTVAVFPPSKYCFLYFMVDR